MFAIYILGWGEITFFMKVQVQVGKYGEILFKNMGLFNIFLIQLKTEARWLLKVAESHYHEKNLFKNFITRNALENTQQHSNPNLIINWYYY